MSSRSDYSRELALIRRMMRWQRQAKIVGALAVPIEAMLRVFGSDRVAGLGESVGSVTKMHWLANLLDGLWSSDDAPGFRPPQFGGLLELLTASGQALGSIRAYDGRYLVLDVHGIPVLHPGEREHVSWYASPATEAELLERILATATAWRITAAGKIEPDTVDVSPLRAAQTDNLIARVRRFDRCRGLTLYGPPRGGKTVAARQIAHAIGDGSLVTLYGESAASEAAWSIVERIRPEAIILDDLDTCVGQESHLLAAVERARRFAKVMIATLNVLPGGGSTTEADGAPVLRGALFSVGRLADEEPVAYAELDDAVRDVLAPSVPEALRGGDLLAGHLLELEERAAAGVLVQGDLDEMRRSMARVGER